MIFLHLLAKLYALFLWLDRRCTRVKRLPAPVISVGNIATGGRAKTPFVVEIVKHLQARGWFPVVLTRGYGRKSRKDEWLRPGALTSFDPKKVGDEAMEIFFKTGAAVLVGKNRYVNALRFLKNRQGGHHLPLCFVLDDGFQHWRLHRDFDLVLVRESDFSDSLIPRGRLRESPQALARADKVFTFVKDFVKISQLRFVPSEKKEKWTYLTTRAPDADYDTFLRQHLRHLLPPLVLRDHATREEILKSLENTQADALALGAKEAIKILDRSHFEQFVEKGESFFSWKGRRYRVAYVELKLLLHKPRDLWQAIDQKLLPWKMTTT